MQPPPDHGGVSPADGCHSAVPTSPPPVVPGLIARSSTLFQRLRGLRPAQPNDIMDSAFDAHGRTGLNTLFTPAADPRLEYVFVHGLAGGSTKTWCLSRDDPALFWPKEWLPLHPAFRTVRIHSFGYDADYTKLGGASLLGIHDFGLALLSALANSECFRDNPIVLVAHSMGGLVAEQKYILSRQDPSLQHLASRISAMVLLGTPHRGSDHAKLLKKLLSLTLKEPPPYVYNLAPANETLARLNVLFQQYGKDLIVHSFYEGYPMGLGGSPIVDRLSAVTGVAGERIAPLNADHRGLCKFASAADPNYQALTDTFGAINRQILGQAASRDNDRDIGDLKMIHDFLGMPEIPEDDLRDTQDTEIEQSCEWLTEQPDFQKWISGSGVGQPCSKIFWLHAKPGTGKSIMAGHIATMLTKVNSSCSYYFFRHDNDRQSSASCCLLSIVWQMAQRDIHVRRRLLSMIGKGVRLDQGSPKAIWRRICEPILYSESVCRQFWILDALDECSDVSGMLMAFAELAKDVPVSLFVTSRPTNEIVSGFHQLARKPSLGPILESEIRVRDTLASILQFVQNNRHKIHISDDTKADNFVRRVLDQSEGCFLWVRLLLDQLDDIWTISQVEEALEDGIPEGMDLLYARCVQSIESKSRPGGRMTSMAKSPTNIDLVRSILAWVLFASRPLTVPELLGALHVDLGVTLQEPKKAISSICGQLVHVDSNDRVLILHLTAKTFLQGEKNASSLYISPADAHQLLCSVCVRFLVSGAFTPANHRFDVPRQEAQAWPAFLSYAAMSSKDHLERAPDTAVLSGLLYEFFQGNVLAWIEFVADRSRLEVLTSTAHVVQTSVLSDVAKIPQDQVVVLQSWVDDIGRLVSLFGPDLIRQPSSIHFNIPPFCPKSSSIRSLYDKNPRGISVLGDTHGEWGFEIACIDSEDGHMQALSVACGRKYFAVCFGQSMVILYHATTCQEWKRLNHKHRVWHILFSQESDLLVCAGEFDGQERSSGITVWNVAQELPRHSFNSRSPILCFRFSTRNNTILAVTSDLTFVTYSLHDGTMSTFTMKCQNGHSGRCWHEGDLAIMSPDETMVAVACMSRYIQVFSTPTGTFLGRLKLDNRGPATFPTEEASFADCAIFNEDKKTRLLAAGYADGTLALFDCDSLELVKAISLQQVMKRDGLTAYALNCSLDGKLLLVCAKTSSRMESSILVFGFQTLRLLFVIPEILGPVRQLTFNVDCSRILEVCRGRCTIWRHDIALPVTDESIATHMSNTTSDSQVQTADIVPDPSGAFFFSTRTDYTLWFRRINPAYPPHMLAKYDGSIRQVVWASNRKTLVVAKVQPDNAERELHVGHLHDLESGQPRLMPHMVIKWESNSPISMSHDDAEEVFFCRGRSMSLWDMKSWSVIFDQPAPSPYGWVWTSNPFNGAERVHWIRSQAIIWDWRSPPNEQSLAIIPIRVPKDVPLVQATSVFGGLKMLLSYISGTGARSHTYYLVDVAPLASSSSARATAAEITSNDDDDKTAGRDNHSEMVPSLAFEAIGRRILDVVGSYGTRIIFLDDRFRICSVELLVDGQGRERFRHASHFFIPANWCVDFYEFSLAVVTSKGDILMRKGSDVVVFQNGLAFEDDVWEVFEE